MFGIDLIELIKIGGYLAVTGIVFAESGLLVGFFLPGDSLLFTAGFLASQGYLDILILIALCFVAAVVGDSLGYSIGKKLGPKIFVREDSFFFDKQHIHRAQAFYDKHGGKAITLARFIPVVRTFAPVVAGIGNMPYHTFFFYNVIGGLLWAVGLPLLGYFAGSFIPNVDRYLVPIIFIIIFLSISPGLVHIVRDREARQELISKLRMFILKIK